jgi:hypothetical protein
VELGGELGAGLVVVLGVGERVGRAVVRVGVARTARGVVLDVAF